MDDIRLAIFPFLDNDNDAWLTQISFHSSVLKITRFLLNVNGWLLIVYNIPNNLLLAQ